MKKYVTWLCLSTLLLASCDMVKKELKKANEVRKSAQKTCDCDHVGVATNIKNGSSTLTVTLHGEESEDLRGKSEEVVAQLMKDVKTICEHDKIIVAFEDGGITESFSFDGCSEQEEQEEEESDVTEASMGREGNG